MEELEKKLGYRFRDRDLLRAALTHKSFNEGGKNHGLDNERLEFLGDSVVNCAIALELHQKFPELSEGELSRLRARGSRTPSIRPGM